MSKYEVYVDYVTTARVVVEASDAESAEQAVWDYVHTEEGYEHYLEKAEKNVKFGEKQMAFGIDGFEFPLDAEEYLEPLHESDRLIDLTKKETSAKHDSERCPVCGSQHIEGDSSDFFPGGAVQHVNCCSCGSDWNDVYKFEKREEVYDATKEEPCC